MAFRSISAMRRLSGEIYIESAHSGRCGRFVRQGPRRRYRPNFAPYSTRLATNVPFG